MRNTSTLPPVPPLGRDTEEALHDAIQCRQWWSTPRWQQRLRGVMRYLLAAIRDGQEVEVYAQNRADFWYKVYFFTPYGVFISDTANEDWTREAYGRHFVARRRLMPVPIRAVLANWDQGGLWVKEKPLSALLLAQWQATQAVPHA
jgi:hypothetical protein